MSPRRYLLWMASTVLAMELAALALAVTVDPYRMFGTRPILVLTALKPRIYQQTGIAKTYALERVRPNTVLLGNSRTEIGLDPASPVWPADMRPVFNASEAGRGLFIEWRMLQEAVAAGPLEHAVLGLDIIDFISVGDGAQGPAPVDADEKRLLVDRAGHANAMRQAQMLRDRIASTLTIDAVADSLVTLFDQNPETSVTMTRDGFNPLHEYRVLARRVGYAGLFEQKNAVYRAQYSDYPKRDFADPAANSSFQSLGRIIATARDRNLKLVLYIHPYHADYLEMLHALGLWPSFEAWKRALVAVVAAAKRGGSDIVLYDFSGYDRFSTEHVPPPGDLRSEMRWYWEPGHYKSALGDQILRRILGLDDGWGRVLDPATIEPALADIDRERQDFLTRLNSMR